MNDAKQYDRVAERLTQLLDTARTERDVQPFLKNHPLLVRGAFNAWAWNSVHHFPEFQFGSDYKADFLILAAHSGAWHTTLVELESPIAKPYNINGTPSAALAKGLAQLDEWQIWIDKHEGLLRSKLAALLKRHKVAAQCSNAKDHQFAHSEIVDPRTVLHRDFVVVIGRRGTFDQDAQERRGVLHERQRYVASYDRLIDAAKKIDWKNA